MRKYARILAAAVLAAAFSIPGGCGDDTTGPTEENGWNTYTVDNITLEWMVVDSTSELHVILTAPTTGWAAVGFDPTSFMQDADLIIGYVDGSGTFLRDDYGVAPTSHQADTSLGGTDDATLIAGSEASGETEIEFTIPLDSGDDYDKVLVEGTTYTVILAYGADGADDFTSLHEYATSVALEL